MRLPPPNDERPPRARAACTSQRCSMLCPPPGTMRLIATVAGLAPHTSHSLLAMFSPPYEMFCNPSSLLMLRGSVKRALSHAAHLPFLRPHFTRYEQFINNLSTVLYHLYDDIRSTAQRLKTGNTGWFVCCGHRL